MDKLAQLDFTTPSNACLSLRTLAEWVRVGEVKFNSVVLIPRDGRGPATLSVEVEQTGGR